MKKQIVRRVMILAGAVFFCMAALGDAARLTDSSTLDVYNGTIRLRVIAHSDSGSDQRVKYAVRDALLEASDALFGQCHTVDAAYENVTAAMPEMARIAEETVRAHGKSYPVSVSLVREAFPVRTYGHFTFPAGTYTALHVSLGDAAGKNWFCVMFPPLCLSSLAENEAKELFTSCGFDDGTVEALTEKKEIRSGIAALIRSLAAK